MFGVPQFLGMHDDVHGSSASVLTGGQVDFGTNGFTLLFNAAAMLERGNLTL